MAELYLKIGVGAKYEDGDILCAMNNRRIRCVHAQHICKPITFNSDGLREINSVSDYFMSKTHRYKFQRISSTEIKRIELATMQEETISNIPNAKGEYMAVALFVQRRIANPKHRVFGSTGAEYWYGGTIDYSDKNLTDIWNKIETDTPLRESNFTLWPAGDRDLKDHFGISVDNFTETEAEDFVSSEIDENDPENPILIKKRTRQIIWKDLPGLSAGTESQIEDTDMKVDIRTSSEFVNASIITVKA